tara:strand:- start:2467 stop:2817 length:351 start_codon:yes stop_codon:yes gene_type:complete
MAISRYIGTRIIAPSLSDGRTERDRLEKQGSSTFSSYPADIFDDETMIQHTLQVGERLDVLAQKYLMNGRYWWMICMVNGITNPVDDKKLLPGSVLNITTNPERIIQLMAAYQSKG